MIPFLNANPLSSGGFQLGGGGFPFAAGQTSMRPSFMGQQGGYGSLGGRQGALGGFAGGFSPSAELNGSQDVSGISNLMQSMMMTALMMQMMQMMQMLQSLVGGQTGVPQSADFGAQSGGASPIATDSSAAPGGSDAGSAAATSGASASGGSAGASVASPKKTGEIVNVPGGRLDKAVAGAFLAMKEAAKKDGVDLQISSSYRSRQEQEVLYAKYKAGTGNLAAKPGTSNHESGLAIDFKNTKGAYSWLAKNAERFGMKNLPGEPWHYSPNGH